MHDSDFWIPQQHPLATFSFISFQNCCLSCKISQLKRAAFPFFPQLPVEEARRMELQEQIIHTLGDQSRKLGEGRGWLAAALGKIQKWKKNQNTSTSLTSMRCIFFPRGTNLSVSWLSGCGFTGDPTWSPWCHRVKRTSQKAYRFKNTPQMAGCIPQMSDIYPVPAGWGPQVIDNSKKGF